jgi:hypothetical protein
MEVMITEVVSSLSEVGNEYQCPQMVDSGRQIELGEVTSGKEKRLVR